MTLLSSKANGPLFAHQFQLLKSEGVGNQIDGLSAKPQKYRYT